MFVQGFLDCEERQMDLQGGRAAVAWLKRVSANLEYGQIPAAQLPLVVSCLLGMGYIKYSELRYVTVLHVSCRSDCDLCNMHTAGNVFNTSVRCLVSTVQQQHRRAVCLACACGQVEMSA